MDIDLRFAILAGALGLSACTVGPNYRRPDVEAPPAWSAAASSASVNVLPGSFDGKRWWTVFNDPLLDALIQEGTAQNIDLKTAALRIASARVQRDQTAGTALPTIAGSTVAGRTRMSENGVTSSLGGAGGSSSASSGALSTNLFQAGFDATWELDLWGRVRRGVEAGNAAIESAEDARRDALASLAAEIARTYFTLRGTERLMAIAQDDIRTQTRSGELVASRFRAGFSSESDVTAQRAQLESVKAQLPQLEQQLAQSRNRLALLLALPPGALDDRLKAAAAPPVLPPSVPIGLPGDLLQRRPDVQRSEAELRSATAKIGVAKARLFPTITLGLAAGLQSTATSSLTDWGSRFFLGGASVSIPIFQGGQLKAQVELADLDAQRAALAYRQTVLTAFHDADNALIAYGQEQRRAASYERQVADARHGRELAYRRWQNGLSAFIEVLDAERTAHQSEQQLAQSTTAASTDLVALYKALGGGWQD